MTGRRRHGSLDGEPTVGKDRERNVVSWLNRSLYAAWNPNRWGCGGQHAGQDQCPSKYHPALAHGPCCGRELNQLLKAWEAMRIGKDAQIASLIERGKRNEEDAAEKARTVEALRRKLAAIARGERQQ